MIRLLNLVAVLGLIGSAIYAYSIKYDTLYQAGQVSRAQSQLKRERQAIATGWLYITYEPGKEEEVIAKLRARKATLVKLLRPL